MDSHFNSQTLAEIFRDIYLGERTGTLTLATEEREERIHFARGLIHLAESGGENGGLGTALVEAKKISSGALEEARDASEDSTDLARSLVNRGLMARGPLAEAIEEIIDETVRSVFTWEGGTASFEDVEQVQPLVESDVLSTFGLILDGILGMREFGPIRDAMQGLDNRLQMRTPGPIPVERLTLSPSHGFILSRVDGATSVRDVISILPEEEEDSALRFLFGMVVMGVLEYDPPLGDGPFKVGNILRDHEDRRALERMQEQTIRHAYELMRKQTPYEVLAVTQTASRDAIERAYEEAKALFSRERILPRVRDRFRSELTVIESRLIEAYLTLTQPERGERTAEAERRRVAQAAGPATADDLLVRVEMDKTKSKVALEKSQAVAEGYFSKARKAMRESDFHNAIQYGKLAVSYNEEDPRFYFLLAECQARNPGARWQHQAEGNYTRASELDPWNIDYLISLGRFYKKRGLILRARKQFEEALTLAPGHDVASVELKKLG